MTINDIYNIIFIHIPKCGGCYIEQNVFPNTRPTTIKKLDFHTGASGYQKRFPFTFARYVKLAIVRNPYARFVSAFFYLKNGGAENKYDLKCKKIIGDMTFEQFAEKFSSDKTLQKMLHFVPMYRFACNGGGNILVDKIIKLENLDKDLPKFFKLYNIPGKIPVVNASKHKPYDEYYQNKEIKEIVYNYYKKDFELFGYNK